ncbi:MAG: glycosyltransferase [Candidatus Omnitrophica bacterium]|nr:glycosyltransferase [Candidatus Omnitrophota bacterium]
MTDGIGHRQAAQAVEEAVRSRLPGAEVACVDLLARCVAPVRRGYPVSYRALVRWLPSCWAIGFYGVDQAAVFRLVQGPRRAWNLAISGEFQRWVRELRPDVAIATHFFPADVLSAGKQQGWLTARLIVAITDVLPHHFWLASRADAFVVACEQTKAACLRRGVPAERIYPLGIPIMGVFGRLPARAAAKERLGLAPTRRTALVASGGMGYGPIRRLTRALAAEEQTQPGRLQLLVVCGDNAALAGSLRREAAGLAMPVHVFGFVSNMHELMAASDVHITKPGGLSIMESLAAGLPMVLSGAIPGQERFNARYVLDHGAAVEAATPPAVIREVLGLLDDEERLEAMTVRARELGRPRAAADLVEQLICPLAT